MQATTVTTPVDRADTVIVLDFETTGLSPAQGDGRANGWVTGDVGPYWKWVPVAARARLP